MRRLAHPILLVLFGACTSSRPLVTDPIKWVDLDNAPIPEPAEVVENQIWDIADHTIFYQLRKVIDVGWSGRRIGNALGVAGHRQADNVNALDEAPASSWFQNRHYFRRLTREELQIGPGIAAPDSENGLEVIAGKFEGGTAGFTIRDSRGQLYLLKFDSEGNNEMGSAAEVIATKVFHACGYNVPRNSVYYFDPAKLKIGEKTTVPDGKGGKHPMLEADLQSILDNIIPQMDGRLRCVASEFLRGRPVGIFNYHGRREDDPNDRVSHEHRRELRGLRVIASWMNDADRRAANTLDMYVTNGDRRGYVKHYLIDMGSAFGSNNLMPHLPKYGNEYVWDPGNVAKSLVTFGFWEKPWERPLPMPYPALGYFENETFDAEGWVPTYPNPAFERTTGRDGYWSAKILLAFTDNDIAALVEMGHYSDPGAAAELTRLLIERRDEIARYWFTRVNPLDRFTVDRRGIRFRDLAIDGGLESQRDTRYRYRFTGDSGLPSGPFLSLEPGQTVALPADLLAGRYYGIELQTIRINDRTWSKATRVLFFKHGPGRYQIVRVERED